jgi:guanylate kinase
MTQKVLGNLAKGLVFIVSAPAGTGKTTLTRMLTAEFSCVEESVSCTTRPPRSGERPGVDYHFLSKEEFNQKISKNDFLEHAEVFGNCYGTSSQYVKDAQNLGKHVVLVIDTQGALKLKDQGFGAVFIFISPPSMEELKQRLISRKTEDAMTIEERLSWADGEMMMSSRYDYLIVNQDLDIAYQILRSIVIAEEHKQINNHA